MEKILKRFSVLIITFTLLFCIVNFAVIADETQNTKENVITVGYNLGSGIFENEQSSSGDGYGYDILTKIENTSDISFEFVEVEGDLIDALRNNEIDSIGLHYRTPELSEEFVYSSIPFGEDTMVLATNDDSEIYYGDTEAIDGKTVATFKGNPANDFLDRYLLENNISVNYVYKNSYDYLEEEADFYLSFLRNLESDNYISVLNLQKYYTYLVFNEEDLARQVDTVLLDIVTNEGNFFLELQEKYMVDNSLSHRSISREEAEILQERPLTVAYVDDHVPYTFTDDDGNANGAIVEILNYLANEYDFDIEYIPYSLSEGEERPNADLLISLVDNNEATGTYVSTETYYNIQIAALLNQEIVEKTGTDLIGIMRAVDSIGILDYHDIDINSFNMAFPDVKINVYSKIDEMLDAYDNNEVQLILFTNNSTQYASEYLNRDDLYFFEADFNLPVSLRVSADIADEYVPIFNILLDNIDESTYSDIILTHTADYVHVKDFSDFTREYWYLFVIGFGIALVLILMYSFRQSNIKKKTIENILNTDEVTGIISLHKFNNVVATKLREAKAKQYQIVSFDIDLFRTINAYYSTECGTNVIKIIAKLLTEKYGDDIVLTRKYADNFVILKHHDDNKQLKDFVNNTIIPEIKTIIGDNFNLSMSFGINVIDDTSQNINIMIDNADVARNKGKNIHKTTFIVFDTYMERNNKTKLHITHRMEEALSNHEFKMVYQPKVDFKTLKIIGAEALVRWIQNDGKVIFPNDFITEFEKNGFISRLDMYVFEEVCSYINKNMNDVEMPIISVNLSPVTILDSELVEKLTAILKKYDIDSTQIELEVTESAMVNSEEEVMLKVKELKNLGFIMSVDDFGAGVSSLNRLGTFEVDILKMDKAFLDYSKQSSKNFIVVENTIKLAKDLGMKVVAEGVESHAQAVWLREIVCDTAQGYYFSKPSSEEDFTNLLKEKKVYTLEEINNT